MYQGNLKCHQYMVNYWYQGVEHGTGCYWRGTDEKEFYRKIKELLKIHPRRPRQCRIVYQKDRTIFSTSSASAYEVWRNEPIFPPAYAEYGIPKEAVD